MSIIGRNKKGSLADQLNFGNKPTEEPKEEPKEEIIEEKPENDVFEKIRARIIGGKTAAEVATDELKKLKEKQQKR